MKIAVVGLGYWGPNLVRNFLSIDGIDGVVACDTLPRRLENIRKKFPTVETTSSFDDVVWRDDIEGVVVSTPVSTHYPLGMRVLKAGKHLLLEKPMASTTTEAEELLDLAYAKMLTLMVDHTFVYTSAVQKMKELINKGDIGDVLYFDSVRVNLGLFQHDTNVIWDLAPHDISIMDYLIDGKPVAVSCVGVNHFSEYEDVAYVTVHFAEKLMAQFHVNWLSPVKVRKILLGGTKLMVVYDDMEASEKIKVYDKGVDMKGEDAVYKKLVQYRTGNMYSPNIDTGEALARMAAEFVDCINTGKPSISDGQAGVNVVKVLEAANISIKAGGRRVDLSYLSKSNNRSLISIPTFSN
ncbi:MAG: Gfo/Idh/MocA family oxidoreductase [Bacteroidetes bacterium]|nr:Gfo/Idh/MocA family oxidoreductase [Bacteroidota bacterium]MCW5895366.1 Gfo/Idh/MocA family oxidoreductase [Bacteroidota bacterium]